MLLYFGTWDNPIALLASCILWMIAACSRAHGWASSFAQIFRKKKAGTPFGNSQVCLQDPSPLWAVNLKP